MAFKKAPSGKVKTSFNFDRIPTTQIMIYLELCTKVLNELQEESYHILNCDHIGNITKEEGHELNQKVQTMMNVYAGGHQALSEEISRRFKKDMKFGMGPADVQKIHHRWVTDYPGLNISKQDAYNAALEKNEKMRKFQEEEEKKAKNKLATKRGRNAGKKAAVKKLNPKTK